MELKWIYLLNATNVLGLNEAVNYKSFLDCFVSGGWKNELLLEISTTVLTTFLDLDSLFCVIYDQYFMPVHQCLMLPTR